MVVGTVVFNVLKETSVDDVVVDSTVADWFPATVVLGTTAVVVGA